MNIDIIYSKIVYILKASNNFDRVLELENSSEGASTGSEVLMQQAAYLLSLKQVDSSIFKLIETEVQEYLLYCKPRGLSIH